jgi:OmpA-OmpF porin, OOP family
LNKPVFYISLFLCFASYAQENLIYNGDFEDFSSCPTWFSTPGDYQLNYCENWYIPTEGTSDYYNSCSISSAVSVPSNITGYQEAYSGNAYTGIWANEIFFGALFSCMDGSKTGYGREYIQQELDIPLNFDSVYYVSFFISLADSSGGYAVKNIGLKFSENNMQSSCFRPIVATPDILSPDFVTDKQNWVKVEGYYKANGTEKFVTIGNFRDTLEFHLDTLCTRPNTDWQDGSGQAYYYIDGISIQKVPVPEMPNVFTPNQDGTNDFIDFSKYCISNECHVTVLNRWGNVVFDSNDGSFIWNGQIQNEVLSDGVYFYVLETNSITKQGFVYLNK